MSSHALLSASASKRWINCPPSARLTENMDDVTSEFAKEGTEAHELCAYLVNKALGKKEVDPRSNFEYYSAEMENCANEYCEYVIEEFAKAKETCPDAKIYIEQRLDYSKWVIDGFGTGDCLIIADDTLEIIDYKHGMGVLVDASGNTQMMLYALGAIDTFGDLFDIKDIKMTIFQPRKDNIETSYISKTDLLCWANGILKPTAKLAYEGKGEYKSGSHCKFCKAKAICKKRMEDNMEIAKEEFKNPDTLSIKEISELLPIIETASEWINDVKDYALAKAISGVKINGYKLVEGRSNRKYTSEEEVAKIVEDAGFDPYERKVMSITAMTSKLGGKKKFDELLGAYVYKPQGKLTLVPDSDARKEFLSAVNDFNDK